MVNFVYSFQPVLQVDEKYVKARDCIVYRGQAESPDDAAKQCKAAYIEKYPDMQDIFEKEPHKIIALGGILMWEGDDEYLYQEAERRKCRDEIWKLLNSAKRIS